MRGSGEALVTQGGLCFLHGIVGFDIDDFFPYIQISECSYAYFPRRLSTMSPFD